jgi:uncharacterized protein YceH (UPF0502 family)
MSADVSSHDQPEKQWRPLSASQRRVVGVLIEKAKTTPDSYPMTLNALTNGCNQKSNRSPQMNMSTDDVEQAVEELREMEAVAEIQSSGRVPKFRHYMYEWLGVDKVELAVMAELFLRGEQTVGELRGRASRMETIPDLHTLRPVLDSLTEKQLVVSLTPPGRGQIVTHNLYSEERMERLKQQYASEQHARPARSPSSSAESASPPVSDDEFAELKSEVARMRADLERLSAEVRSLQHQEP